MKYKCQKRLNHEEFDLESMAIGDDLLDIRDIHNSIKYLLDFIEDELNYGVEY